MIAAPVCDRDLGGGGTGNGLSVEGPLPTLVGGRRTDKANPEPDIVMTLRVGS